jgi:hypothetical protein
MMTATDNRWRAFFKQSLGGSAHEKTILCDHVVGDFAGVRAPNIGCYVRAAGHTRSPDDAADQRNLHADRRAAARRAAARL